MWGAALVLAFAAVHDLGLAAGQENLWRAHVDDFPKAAWVVGEGLAVSSTPRLSGRLVKVLPVGERVQIAGVVEPLARPVTPPVLDEVLAIPVRSEGRRPGYVLARGLAVFETLLGHAGPDVTVFASVLGQVWLEDEGGLVLEVAVWLQRGSGTPEQILAGLNAGSRLEVREGQAGGIAVGLSGQVVVLDERGGTAWRSPKGETWAILGAESDGYRLAGPDGEILIPAPGSGEKEKAGARPARKKEEVGCLRSGRGRDLLTHFQR